MNELLEHLSALGFGEYEGRAYITLLQKGPLTGYQLAKASGIPRPNIYAVLDRLKQRGAALDIQVKRGLQYAAVPPEEMLSTWSRTIGIHLNEARWGLQEVIANAPAAPEYVGNLQGYESILGRAEAVLENARGMIVAGIWSHESRKLASAFAGAQARGVTLTILCLQGCPQECGTCAGAIYRYSLVTPSQSRWLILAADDRELLVGQMPEHGLATAALTRSQALVGVGSQFIRNSIAAAELVRSLGSQLPSLIDPQALETLRGAPLATDGASWLDMFLSAVQR